jgi:hypothetical protein
MTSMSNRWLLKAVSLLVALVLGSAGLCLGSQEVLTPVASSGAWCGPRAVYAICKAEGKTIPFSDILEWCKCDAAGYASVKDLEAALQRAGFHTSAVKLNQQVLHNLKLMAILVNSTEGSAGHCVALLHDWEDRSLIFDGSRLPMIGEVRHEHLPAFWDGTTILVSRSPIVNTTNWSKVVPAASASLLVCMFVIGVAVALGRWMRWSFGPKRTLGYITLATMVVGGAVAAGIVDRTYADKSVSVKQETPAATGAAVLVGAPAQINLGKVSLSGGKVPFSFRMKNNSSKTIRIVDVKRSCSCLDCIPQANDIKPGESVAFSGTIDTAKSIARGSFAYRIGVVGSLGGSAFDILGIQEIIGEMVGLEEWTCDSKVIALASGEQINKTIRICRKGFGAAPPRKELMFKSAVAGLEFKVIDAGKYDKDGGQWSEYYKIAVTGRSSAGSPGELAIYGSDELSRPLSVVPIQFLRP